MWRTVDILSSKHNKISRTLSATFSSIILFWIIFSPKYLSNEYYAPIIVLVALGVYILCSNIYLHDFFIIMPLCVIFIIGILGAIANTNYQFRDVLRDITYSLTPIALFYIGYVIATNNRMWPLILKIFIFSGCIMAAMHLSAFIDNESLITSSLSDVRSEAGGTSDLVVLSIVLGLYQYRIGAGNLFSKMLPRYIAITLLLSSLLLSYSRTHFVIGFILLISMGGFFTRGKLRLLILLIVIVTGFFFSSQMVNFDNVETFSGKFVRSIKELTVTDYKDYRDITNNWRGFETSRALITFSKGNPLQLIFGQGHGALVDLGFEMTLNEYSYRYIPVLHNGYAYILVKTGLIGLFCYLVFYYKLIKLALSFSNSINNGQRIMSLLLLGCVISLMTSMFVVGGMCQIHNSEFVLFTGFLFRALNE